MDARKEHEALRENYDAAKIAFIITELDLALTFCEIAASADNDDKALRNTTNTCKAYDSATHFLASAEPMPEVKQEISKKVARLRSLLADLGTAP